MHRVGDLVRAVASLALTLTLVAGCSADVSLSGAPDAAGTPTEPPAEADPTPTTTPESEPEEPTAVEAPTPGSGPLIDHPLATGLLGTDDLGTIWTVVRTDLVLTGSAPAATPNPGGCVLLGQVNRATEWFAIQTELDGPDGRHLLHQLGRAPDERSAAEVVASVTALPGACPTLRPDGASGDEITLRAGPAAPGLATVVFGLDGVETALIVAHQGDVVTAALFDAGGRPVTNEELGGLADNLRRALARVGSEE